MDTKTINAATNPDLANKLVEQAVNAGAETDAQQELKLIYPSKLTVDLPGGYITPSGEVIREATVRELTGKDEEVISRVDTVGKSLLTILSRGTVSIGEEPATEELLDQLLVADREALLLGIYKATFGPIVELNAWFNGESKVVEVNLDEEINMVTLDDPIADREFTISYRGKEFLVGLPTGAVQKAIFTNNEKTVAELGTIFLENTVISINGDRVYKKDQVQNLGVAYRTKISDEITKRNPGPKFEPIRVTDPESGAEAVIPISLGALFRF